jgi:hypothetical protein
MKKADRYNDSKLKWSLVDFDSLEEMVKVLEFGIEKYEIDNWKLGMPTLEICESMLRHLFAYMRGENSDSESGLSHIGHIMCNAMFLSYMEKNKPEMDNRRIKFKKITNDNEQKEN